MPFGLNSASITFTRGMKELTRPIKDFTETYIDDIAVFSASWEDHLRHLRIFLTTIQEAGLTLNLEKCTFARGSVKFLGHVIGEGRIGIDPQKLHALEKIRPPSTKKEVRRLIGFFNYFQQFLPQLADTLYSITELTKKSAPRQVNWTDKHQEGLDRATRQLKEASSLYTIDYQRQFGLMVDASDHAVGCCLLQWDEQLRENPIAFASKKLTEPQTRWATIEREAYAVIWALNKFRSVICLSKIKVFTDHNPLTFLTETTPKSAKLTRWALALQEYELEFVY